MLHIITSRSDNLWDIAAHKMRDSYHQGKQVILLVPDQYTLQAERDSITALGTKGFFRLQVLSPSRLQKQVLDRLGRDPRVPIDEQGQMMTMARVLWQQKDLLSYYGSAMEQTGFTHKLVAAVSELKSAGIKPDALVAYTQQQEDSLPPRLFDLAQLYERYESLLQGQLADKDDQARDMLSRLSGSQLFAGAQVIVYGFDLLTEPLIRLLATLALQVAEILVLQVSESTHAPDGDAFASVQDSITRLMAAFDSQNLPHTIEHLKNHDTAKPPALLHLADHLLRLQPGIYADFPEGLRIYAGRTPHEEVRRAAQLVYQDLADGISPRDIVVILAQESYAQQLTAVFSDYQLPHYLSIKEPMLSQPLVRCLLDALHIIKAAVWRMEDVVLFAKNPFSPLSGQEGFDLQNYALAFGIRGSKWTKPFVKGDEDQIMAMEALRQKVVQPVERLRKGLVGAKDAGQSVAAVLRFLTDMGAQNTITTRVQWLHQQGMQEEAMREGQVWDKLMALLAQMQALWGKERIILGRFADWIKEGLSMTELSALPPVENAIQVGIMGQLKPKTPQKVYLLGLNNGTLSLSDEALLQDEDRGKLEQGLGLRMNLKLQDREAIKQLDLWKALTFAQNSLWISYALGGDDGSTLAPLTYVSRIARMFPLLVEEGGAVASLREPQPFSPAVALDEIANQLYLGTLHQPWESAFTWLSQSPDWHRQAAAIAKAAGASMPQHQLPQPTAQALFPISTTSVSRLETFAGCPFQHFVIYGLRPLERLEWKLVPQDLGTFAHEAMEGFTRLARQHKDWPQVDQQTSHLMMEKVLSPLTSGWQDAPWADTKRSRAFATRMESLLKHMAWTITQAGQVSGFVPLYSELRFGMDEASPAFAIANQDGKALSLRGTIDRLDVASTPDGSLVRVIDYKTGGMELKAGDVEAGAQLQLLLYLQAAQTLLPHLSPAGAFYQRLTDPVVRAESEEEALRERLKRLRLSGVVLAENEVLALMDQASPPLSLPKYIKKDGSLTDNDRLLSREQMQQLLTFAQNKATNLATQITEGLIRRSPLVKSNGRAACAFCPFEGVCRRGKVNREPYLRLVDRKAKFASLGQKDRISTANLP